LVVHTDYSRYTRCRNVEYAKLGFPCSYLASKIYRGITGQRIATDDAKRVEQYLEEVSRI
jgi:hypothetical protein